MAYVSEAAKIKRQNDCESHPAFFNSLVAGVGFEPTTSGL
jgi:hypothetical protein